MTPLGRYDAHFSTSAVRCRQPQQGQNRDRSFNERVKCVPHTHGDETSECTPGGNEVMGDDDVTGASDPAF